MKLLLVLVTFLCLSSVLRSNAAPRGKPAVAPVVRGVVSTAAKAARTIVGGVRQLFNKRWGARLDSAFEDKSGVIGSSEHLAKLEAIIDELTKENEILRQQGFIYKKNVQYHKDIVARLRREKEGMRSAMENIKAETTAELTKQFLREKEEMMKELTVDFDKKSKAMKLELKDAKAELKAMSKELESALAGTKGLSAIKAELREVSGKLSESEALVKTLQASLNEKDRVLREKEKVKATAAAKKTPASTSTTTTTDTGKTRESPKSQSKPKSNEGEAILKASSSSSSASASRGSRAKSGGGPRPKATSSSK